MTVKELIERLNELDPDLPVALTVPSGPGSEMAEATVVSEGKLYTWHQIANRREAPRCVHIEAE